MWNTFETFHKQIYDIQNKGNMLLSLIIFGAASILPRNITALKFSSVDTSCSYNSPSDLSHDQNSLPLDHPSNSNIPRG